MSFQNFISTLIGLLAMGVLLSYKPPIPNVETSLKKECYQADADWSGGPNKGEPLLKCPGDKVPKIALMHGKLCVPGDEECSRKQTYTSWMCDEPNID